MKYLLTFCGGASFMSLIVVASNSQPGWMFLFGAIMASCVILVSRRRLGRRVGAVAVGSGTGTTASEYAGVGVDGDTHSVRVSRAIIPGYGLPEQDVQSSALPRVAGSEPAHQLHLRERLRTTTTEPKTRRAPTHCNLTSKRVQSAMLRPIQQDLLSALVNLGVPYNDAYNAALANTAASFDEAFKVAIASLNVGKRKAAA